MLRTESEYRQAVERLREQHERNQQQRADYVASGLTTEEVERAMAPLLSFNLELREEIEDYERLKRGEIDETVNLRGIGVLLVRSRIASGLSQKELAERLKVDPSQVSRDERNDYHGVTLDRACRVFEALGVDIRSVVEINEKQFGT
jgi:ribosome-binding protein aMBF1 (putative translation factor)